MGKIQKYLVLWFRYFFAAHLLFSALRYFISFTAQPKVEDRTMVFITAMDQVGLYPIVKGTELIVGACLLFNFFVPIALLVEMPISVIIFYLNFFVALAPMQHFTGPQELFLNGFLLVAYGGYFKAIFQRNLPPKPLWLRSTP